MKVERRSIGKSLIFCLLTCGIYGWYWFYSMINDMCDMTGRERSGGKDVLLSFLTCGLYGVYAIYRTGVDIDKVKQQRGMNPGSNGILFLVLWIIGFMPVAMVLAQHNINELC